MSMMASHPKGWDYLMAIDSWHFILTNQIWETGGRMLKCIMMLKQFAKPLSKWVLTLYGFL
jgi:hypothetical protein